MIDLKNIHQRPQRQDSTIDQLMDLYHVANKFGLYDAADYVHNRVEENSLNWINENFARR